MGTSTRKWAAATLGAATLAAAGGVVGVGVGAAASTAVSATLTAAKEVPKPTGSPKGTGRFTGTIGKGRVLRWKLTFTGLSSATAGAHIHIGKPGKTGPVAVVLCGTVCTSPMRGRATLTAAQVTAIRAGGAYVNVHTVKNPSGEIRGQIAIVK